MRGRSIVLLLRTVEERQAGRRIKSFRRDETGNEHDLREQAAKLEARRETAKRGINGNDKAKHSDEVKETG